MKETKRGTSVEQKKREGAEVNKFFLAAQEREPLLSQESLAGEMEVSQGLIGQWFSGKTNIPDKRLIWMGARLGFNPLEIRPEISYLEGQIKNTNITRIISESQDLNQIEIDAVLQHIRLLKSHRPS